MEYIVLAIPFFFLLIAIELVVGKIKGNNTYRLADAVTSLNAGVVSRVNQIFRAFIPLTVYAVTFEHLALFEWPDTWVTWLAAFVIYDFFYYWLHRYGHEINLFWAAHVVHHSSEDYNLSTALRQTSGYLLAFVFFLPMAILGIPVKILFAITSLNLLYQFWVHTQHIGKLGWYELFFITPSNHRVHHAINEEYIDKNYGGVFIIWDRMFGTFQEELDDVPCVYGVRKPLHSWNPIWANIQVYWQLMKDTWRTESYKDKFLIWFKPTGWRPADVVEKYPLPKFDMATFKKFDTNTPTWVSGYVFAQQLLLLAATYLLLSNIADLSVSEIVAYGLYLLLTAWLFSVYLTSNQHIIWLELIRYSAIISVVYFNQSMLLGHSLVGFGVVSIVSLVIIKNSKLVE
ncbi:MAG: sterol desaturase family protein, partial [Kangiellaceae bacterium]|nr:sterol desaturase family protein [Kangiellaceae bacterium]